MPVYWSGSPSLGSLTAEGRARVVEMCARLNVRPAERLHVLRRYAAIFGEQFDRWEVEIVRNGIPGGNDAASER